MYHNAMLSSTRLSEPWSFGSLSRVNSSRERMEVVCILDTTYIQDARFKELVSISENRLQGERAADDAVLEAVIIEECKETSISHEER